MKGATIAGSLFAKKIKTKRENVADMLPGRVRASRLAEKTSAENPDGPKWLWTVAVENSSKNNTKAGNKTNNGVLNQ